MFLLSTFSTQSLSISEGSLEETDVDTSACALEYSKSQIRSLNSINALDLPILLKPTLKRFKKLFTHEEVLWLTDVY